MHISLDVDRELQVVFVRLKEGIPSVQCSMRLKKIAEGLALLCLVKQVTMIGNSVWSRLLSYCQYVTNSDVFINSRRGGGGGKLRI